jgi:Lipocalin-like domain
MVFCRGKLLAVALAVALAGSVSGAEAQEVSLKQQLTGTWLLASAGGKSESVGPNAKGIVIFDAGGNFAVQLAGADIPQFASHDRQTGTPAENRATVRGSLAYFGTYAANPADKSVTLHITGSSFPNWNGSDRKWSVAAAGNTLTLSESPGDATLVLNRPAPTVDFRGGRGR